MRYLCLCYTEAQSSPTAAAGEATDRDELRTSGALLAAATITGSDVTCIRVRNGALAVDAAPDAASSRQLTEILVIDARDFNHAISIAAALPAARSGAIELRPADPHAGVS